MEGRDVVSRGLKSPNSQVRRIPKFLPGSCMRLKGFFTHSSDVFHTPPKLTRGKAQT